MVINYHDICQTYDIFGDKLSFNNEKIRIKISSPISVYRSLTLKELLLQKSEPRTSMWGMTYTGCLDQFFYYRSN